MKRFYWKLMYWVWVRNFRFWLHVSADSERADYALKKCGHYLMKIEGWPEWP